MEARQRTEFAYMEATELLELLAAGDVTSVELLEYYVRRAERLRSASSHVVVVTALPAARRRAAEADAARARGQSWGDLHGLPMTVKEELNVMGMPTTTGSPELAADGPAGDDSAAVARLVAAGAIIWGKTNVPVGCLDWQTYNPLHGSCRNPYDPQRSAGGSSGGSATALALGLTPLEVGGDAAGSIRCGTAVFGASSSHSKTM